MSVDDVWDRAERRQEQHEADLHKRIAELEAEVAMWQRMARDGAEHEVAGLERIAELGEEVQHQIERREEEKLRAVNAEGERDAATNAMDNLPRKLTEAEEERDKWADSFRQAEAALEGFLGPDGLSPYERERDAARAERDALRDRVRELEQGNLEESGWLPREGGQGK